MGFYAGFLIVRYLREEIDGPPRRRIAVIVAAAVVEFGPAEIIDTALIRPAAMFLGSLATGNVIIGVLIGKVAADIVFYGLAITSYEVLVRRFLHRFRRTVSVGDEGGAATASQHTAGRGGRHHHGGATDRTRVDHGPGRGDGALPQLPRGAAPGGGALRDEVPTRSAPVAAPAGPGLPGSRWPRCRSWPP